MSTATGFQMLQDPNSRKAFEKAKSVFPDGTTRVTVERSPYPRYIRGGHGAWLEDVDGNRFLDLHANFTALIHGHGFDPVMSAVKTQLESGTCFANPTEAEIELAALLCSRVPNVDRIRFVNSGTEAVMFAIKAARAYTGRPAIAKIEGAYHGGYDWVEISQTSKPETWGSEDEPNPVPFYRGVPQSVLDEVVTIRFNDAENATRLLDRHGARLSAVVIDPMPSRAGLIAPEPAFVEAIQQSCRRNGILLIADEVFNFRQSYHGAAHRHGIDADLFAFGKIIGGGFPIGAVGGRSEIMSVFSSAEGAPAVPQGGTFSANPIAMVAGYAGMSALTPAAFERLEQLGNMLRSRLQGQIERYGASFSITGAASLLRLHPTKQAPKEYRDTILDPAQAALLKRLVAHFTSNGILLPATAAMALSTPITETEIGMIADLFTDFLDSEKP